MFSLDKIKNKKFGLAVITTVLLHEKSNLFADTLLKEFIFKKYLQNLKMSNLTYQF